MDLGARLATHAFSAGAAGISFIVQPIPGSDQLFVIPIQYLLTASLAKERGASLSKAAWSQVHQIIWGGGALRLMLTMTLGLIPLAGAVTNAFTAFVTTEYLGHYVDRALDNPDKPPPALSIQDILDSITSLFTTRART
ncbi:hypothetical protein WMF45_24975 [Sorangium sp. So ce448]|uniref:hypothetical protein n=1 Tax=unclassified Sorangium TaxID=2621164 RepID=UPI003F5C8EF4